MFRSSRRNGVAGVDANPNRDADLSRRGVAHSEARSDSPFGVIVMNIRYAEDHHDVLGCQFLHCSAMDTSRRAGDFEISAHYRASCLRVLAFDERACADNVSEEHRHKLSFDRVRAFVAAKRFDEFLNVVTPSGVAELERIPVAELADALGQLGDARHAGSLHQDRNHQQLPVQSRFNLHTHVVPGITQPAPEPMLADQGNQDIRCFDLAPEPLCEVGTRLDGLGVHEYAIRSEMSHEIGVQVPSMSRGVVTAIADENARGRRYELLAHFSYIPTPFSRKKDMATCVWPLDHSSSSCWCAARSASRASNSSSVD